MDLFKTILESNIINFLIAAVAIVYIMAKLIPESTNKRKKEIQKELLTAEYTKKAAEEKLIELKKEIENAKLESVKIVENAKKNAEAIKTQSYQDAKQELERLNANAHKEIEMQKTIAINSLKEQITQLTMTSLEKSLIEKKAELDTLITTKLKRDLEKQKV